MRQPQPLAAATAPAAATPAPAASPPTAPAGELSLPRLSPPSAVWCEDVDLAVGCAPSVRHLCRCCLAEPATSAPPSQPAAAAARAASSPRPICGLLRGKQRSGGTAWRRNALKRTRWPGMPCWLWRCTELHQGLMEAAADFTNTTCLLPSTSFCPRSTVLERPLGQHRRRQPAGRAAQLCQHRVCGLHAA